MNRSYSKRKYARASSGQSMVEFAIAVGVLSLLLVVVADFARVFYESVGLQNAARAGAQYGSQSVITAADVNGMEAAATLDGANVASLTPTASQCTCESGTSVASCPSSYCSANSTATFVEVDTSATFKTIVNYPGVPSSLTLTGKAVMQVEQ
jgi:Flp pilus assembly protein TadG